MKNWLPRLILVENDSCIDTIAKQHLLYLLAKKGIVASIRKDVDCVQMVDVVLDFQDLAKGNVSAMKGDEMMLEVCYGETADQLVEKIVRWFIDYVHKAPVWGCVLIGGMSRRMGRPKHLIEDRDGRSWLERTVKAFLGHVEKVFVVGKGEIPVSLTHLPRINDVEGVEGPLSGILAAMRSYPYVSWLVSACDMPFLDDAGFSWLLRQRDPYTWGVVPRQNSGRLEPLFAYYDFRSRELFEQLYEEKDLRIASIYTSAKIISPEIPEKLSGVWKNCNTPEDAAVV